LTSSPKLVLRWLESHGLLMREGSGNPVGTSGKRQVKVVVARNKSGERVRIGVYKILAGADQLERHYDVHSKST
jgi:hypothetical protein